MSLLQRAIEIYEKEGAMELILASNDYVKWRIELGQKRINNAVWEKVYGEDCQDVMDADWDNLVILDACRFDVFEELNTLPGILDKRQSCGSSTEEFLKQTVDRDHLDTVYVTANPQYRVWELNGSFHDILDVWETDWDEDKGTVLPQAVTERAIEARSIYPNKRLLIHYLQPHYPFIGPTGQRLPSTRRVESLIARVRGDDPERSIDVWDQLRRGVVDKEDVITAYRENLELTFPHIKTLNQEIDGKMVVTSDHGNLYGERVFPFISRLYGHPSHVRAKALMEIPWLEIPSENRRSIEASDQQSARDASPNSQVTKRLKELGYME